MAANLVADVRAGQSRRTQDRGAAVRPAMSAMPPIATQLVHRGELKQCAKNRQSAERQNRALFDDLVGGGEQRLGNAWAERLSCRVMGLPGKPDGMNGAEVEKYYRDGHIRQIAEYCDDVLNTYRVWLRHELFRGSCPMRSFKPACSGKVEAHRRDRHYCPNGARHNGHSLRNYGALPSARGKRAEGRLTTASALLPWWTV